MTCKTWVSSLTALNFSPPYLKTMDNNRVTVTIHEIMHIKCLSKYQLNSRQKSYNIMVIINKILAIFPAMDHGLPNGLS